MARRNETFFAWVQSGATLPLMAEANSGQFGDFGRMPIDENTDLIVETEFSRDAKNVYSTSIWDKRTRTLIVDAGEAGTAGVNVVERSEVYKRIHAAAETIVAKRVEFASEQDVDADSVRRKAIRAFVCYMAEPEVQYIRHAGQLGISPANLARALSDLNAVAEQVANEWLSHDREEESRRLRAEQVAARQMIAEANQNPGHAWHKLREIALALNGAGQTVQATLLCGCTEKTEKMDVARLRSDLLGGQQDPGKVLNLKFGRKTLYESDIVAVVG